jgi:acyl-CoA thioester hydrolase
MYRPGIVVFLIKGVVMNNLTKGYPVVIEIPVAWGEMDAFQHVNNTAYFRYFESARIAYFEKINILDLMNRTGIGPILASTSCRFKIPLKYPDKVLSGVRVTNIGEDRFIMNYIVISTKHKKIAAEGDGVIVTFNYRENRKSLIPEELRRLILDIEKCE